MSKEELIHLRNEFWETRTSGNPEVWKEIKKITALDDIAKIKHELYVNKL